jgi:hypothetical protein
MGKKGRRTFRPSKVSTGCILLPVIFFSYLLWPIYFVLFQSRDRADKMFWLSLLGTLVLLALFLSLLIRNLLEKLTLDEQKITFREAGRKTEVDYSDIKGVEFFEQRGFDCAQLHGILIYVPSSVAVAPHPLDNSWIPSHYECPPGERLVMLNLSLFEIFDVGMILGLIRQAAPEARMNIGLPVGEQESRKMRAGIARAGSVLERNEQDQGWDVKTQSSVELEQ